MNTKALRRRVACLLLVALAPVACTNDSTDRRFFGKSLLVVGMHNDLPGVSLLENYQRSGTDVLLTTMLKTKLKVEISPTEVSSKDRITKLRSGQVDLVVGSFSITPERMRQIDFVGPYLTTRQGFLVGPDDANIKVLADLNGKRVCTWEGTTSENALEQLRTQKVDMLIEADATTCMADLKSGRVAAVSTDQTILYGYANLNAAAGFRVVPDLTIGAPQHYGIGLPKGHRDDCRRLKGIIKEYVESSAWIEAIRVSLPQIPIQAPGWISNYKPIASTVDKYSCLDEPIP
ncbi:transporter substrate-binding domain-containing protein [Embleya hyalina]|uniref:ABC transporter substrate-binding protein n=1 Tax=Embleya hyalina TaxID=516124 RepID=A0A401YJV3_9ACTN|nr:transporter substrate-binding domain-containing protein [Embleya hyalina]GCD94867.1 ABC transporter substrate-binding protein [Embleya hyalina]